MEAAKVCVQFTSHQFARILMEESEYRRLTGDVAEHHRLELEAFEIMNGPTGVVTSGADPVVA